MKNRGTIIPIAIGAATAVAVSVVLSAVSVLIIQNKTIGVSGLPVIGIVINCLSTLIGCIASLIASNSKPAITCVLVAGVYLITMLILNWTFMPGIRRSWYASVLAVLVVSAVAALTSARLETKKRYR